MMRPSRTDITRHYANVADKPFFPRLNDLMTSAPVVAMCWQGRDVVSQARKILGQTCPKDSEPGSIRGDHAIDGVSNLVHGSDSVVAAEQELAMWFEPHEIHDWKLANADWIYE